MSPWLGLDVGGANLKAALASGEAESLRFPVWKRPEDLPAALAEILGRFPDRGGIALTMTAELCDCFETKAEGVRAVLDAASAASGGRPIRVWGTDGKFRDVAEARDRPTFAAASNWLALATLAARLVPVGPGILIDVGSTTPDLIPLLDGRPDPIGLDDTARLRSSTLLYVGVRRTPLCALAPSLNWRGSPIGLAAELFATTLDVYLTLGAIPSDPLDLDTSDGRLATVPAARDRLARMVGADRDGFSEADALDLARSADLVLLERLVDSAGRSGRRPRSAVVAGSGEFLARRVAERVVGPGGAVVSLAGSIGPAASVAACAFAVATLAGEGG